MISHSNRKTNRRFLPNLLTKKIFDEKTGTSVRIKLTARALRTLAKNPAKYSDRINQLAKKAVRKRLKAEQK